MASRVALGLISFVADGEDELVIWLKAESALVWQPGLKPQIWSFLASHKEVAKLKGNVGRTGTLNLGDRTQSDVKIARMRIVDCEPRGLAVVAGAGAKPIYSEYRICLADFREGFVSPKGGRLTLGVINPKPAETVQKGAVAVKGDELEMTFAQMVTACLGAMGLTADLPPSGDIKAPRDVKWFGNHAPSELEKLLKRAKWIFCPRLDGTVRIEVFGQGTLPAFGAEQVGDFSAPSIDRRGKTCIITSYPTRAVDTWNLKGPGKDWAFAAQDSDGKWKTNANLKVINTTMEDAVRSGFPGVSKFRTRLMSQAYRFAIFTKSAQVHDGAAGVLPYVQNQDKTVSQPELQSVVIVRDPITKLVKNSSEPMSVPISFIRNGSIVQFPFPIGKVNPENVDDPDANFREIPADSATLVITVERTKKNPGGDNAKPLWVPVYFEQGYTKDASGVQELSEAETANALSGSGDDVIVLCRPELGLLYVDDAAVNKDELKAAAKAIAADVLRQSGASIRHIIGRGWQQAELSGQVSKITWDVAQQYWTDCEVDGWFAPGAALDPQLYRERMEDDFPDQAKTQAPMTAGGASGTRPPVLPLGNASANEPYLPPLFPVLVTVDGGDKGSKDADCTWTYSLFSMTSVAIAKAVKQIPATARYPKTEYERVPDLSLGLGYRDQEGSIKLYHVAREIAATDDACPEDTGGGE